MTQDKPYIRNLHPMQEKLYALSHTHDLDTMTFEEIAELIGAGSRQLVKQHMSRLYKLGLISLNPAFIGTFKPCPMCKGRGKVVVTKGKKERQSNDN